MSRGRDGIGELADLDAMFRGLAHPSRRHILLVLHVRGGRMTAGEIADRFSCSWPTTTRHLKVLEQAGLLRLEKRGRERIYVVESSKLANGMKTWLRGFSKG